MELYARDIRSGPSFRSILRPRLSTWEAILAAWEPWAPLGYLGQSAQIPLELTCSRLLHAYKTQTGIFKDLEGYLTKLRQLTMEVTVTGHSRCWGVKMGPRSRWSKLMHARWWNRSLRTEMKTLNPVPTSLKTQPNDDNDSKDRQIWGGQKSHLHMITTNSGRLEYRVQLDVSCLPPHHLPAHTII